MHIRNEIKNKIGWNIEDAAHNLVISKINTIVWNQTSNEITLNVNKIITLNVHAEIVNQIRDYMKIINT